MTVTKENTRVRSNKNIIFSVIGVMILLLMLTNTSPYDILMGLKQSLGPSPSMREKLAELGLTVTTTCYATARFGRLLNEDGWNVCMQAPFVDISCKEDEWECQWKAVHNYKWPPDFCNIFSFGSNWNFMFEISLARTGCKVHVFDASMSNFKVEGLDAKLKKETGVEFHDIGLDVEDVVLSNGWSMKRLETIMSELGVSRLEILKIDIGGSEWGFFEYFLQSGMLEGDSIRQILLETHYVDSVENEAIWKIMRGLTAYGFKIWLIEENPECGYLRVSLRPIHGCMKFYFIRTQLISPNKF